MPKPDIESLGVMGWGLGVRKFFRRRRRRRRRPPKFVSTTQNRYHVLSKHTMSIFWGKAPAGALPPSTVLLRGFAS